MLRIIGELNPRWILVENVSNLRTKGADEVLIGLEAEGYTCWPTVVGAWALGAPHNRERVWILAMADANSFGHIHSEIEIHPAKTDNHAQRHSSASGIEIWPARIGSSQYAWESRRMLESSMGRAIDGIPNGLDRLKSLGNSVVPQIPELFGHAILQLDKQFKEAK